METTDIDRELACLKGEIKELEKTLVHAKELLWDALGWANLVKVIRLLVLRRRMERRLIALRARERYMELAKEKNDLAGAAMILALDPRPLRFEELLK